MKHLSLVLLAPFVFGACRTLPAYELDFPYGQRGYLILHVKDTPQRLHELTGDDGKTEEVYGLRRADKYVSSTTAGGYWMAFWGDQPADPHAGGHRVLKNPWLVRARCGRWQAANVAHKLTPVEGAPSLLKEIRAGAKGEPRLVYAAENGAETILPVSGWKTIRTLRFQPPADAESR